MSTGARIEQLRQGVDRTRELTADELTASRAHHLHATTPRRSPTATSIIVTVPTPIDQAKRPDLSALIAASRTVGGALSKGNVVVYEFDGLSRRDRGGLRADPGARCRG